LVTAIFNLLASAVNSSKTAETSALVLPTEVPNLIVKGNQVKSASTTVLSAVTFILLSKSANQAIIIS